MPTHDSTAKAIIAELLFECEIDVKLAIPSAQNFYQFLFDNIRPENYKNYRIISFNYDRSFEHYFARAIRTLLGCDYSMAIKKLDELKIEHIHGRLSALPGEDKFKNGKERDQFEYGYYRSKLNRGPTVMVLNQRDPSEDRRQAFVQQQKHSMWTYGQSSFKTVYQNNDLNSVAKSFIDESDRVFFLGFAYHELNMKILGFGEHTNFKNKKMAGTSLNMGNIEVKGIQKKYPEIKLLKPVDCLTFFKDHFSITDPSLDDI